MLKSILFRLNKNDWIKGTFLAFLTPILVFLSSALGVPGFTFSSLDLNMLIKIGLASMLGYMVKNFMSDEQGKILGHIG